MGKYGPQDEVRLKKEVQRLTDEVAALLLRRDELIKENGGLVDKAQDKRDELTHLENAVATRIRVLNMSLVSIREQVD